MYCIAIVYSKYRFRSLLKVWIKSSCFYRVLLSKISKLCAKTAHCYWLSWGWFVWFNQSATPKRRILRLGRIINVLSLCLQTSWTGDVARSSYKTLERNQYERNYERNRRILYFPHHAHECCLLPQRSQHVPYDEDVTRNVRWSRRLEYWFGGGKIINM